LKHPVNFNGEASALIGVVGDGEGVVLVVVVAVVLVVPGTTHRVVVFASHAGSL
jgi:hypothetical protein